MPILWSFQRCRTFLYSCRCTHCASEYYVYVSDSNSCSVHPYTTWNTGRIAEQRPCKHWPCKGMRSLLRARASSVTGFGLKAGPLLLSGVQRRPSGASMSTSGVHFRHRVFLTAQMTQPEPHINLRSKTRRSGHLDRTQLFPAQLILFYPEHNLLQPLRTSSLFLCTKSATLRHTQRLQVTAEPATGHGH
jgi:hypothetical protein